MVSSLSDLTSLLASRGIRRKIAVVNGCDNCTLTAVKRAVETGFAEAFFYGNTKEVFPVFPENAEYVHCMEVEDVAEAARMAVRAVRDGKADILMKGLVETAVLLKAVLDKNEGLLPPGAVLSHLAVTEWKPYGKLLFFSDSAVIPFPTPEQRRAQVGYAACVCRALGIEEPRIALIHCSEKASDKFPYTADYSRIIEESLQGCFGRCVVDGPLDVRTSIDSHALHVKGISSPLEGRSDVLIFPDIESGNAFYKTVTYMVGSPLAAMLVGTSKPVILSSRGDDSDTKYNCMTLAALSL